MGALYIGDATLGLQSQAWAVLALLGATECHDLGAEYDAEWRAYKIEIKTRAWYNGRERGFSLEVRPSMASRKALLVTCGEGRCTDSIFVDAWEVDDFFLNPPTVADFTDEAYANRTSVPYGNAGQAVKVIREKITAFMRRNCACSKCGRPYVREVGRSGLRLCRCGASVDANPKNEGVS